MASMLGPAHSEWSSSAGTSLRRETEAIFGPSVRGDIDRARIPHRLADVEEVHPVLADLDSGRTVVGDVDEQVCTGAVHQNVVDELHDQVSPRIQVAQPKPERHRVGVTTGARLQADLV